MGDHAVDSGGEASRGFSPVRWILGLQLLILFGPVLVVLGLDLVGSDRLATSSGVRDAFYLACWLPTVLLLVTVFTRHRVGVGKFVLTFVFCFGLASIVAMTRVGESYSRVDASMTHPDGRTFQLERDCFAVGCLGAEITTPRWEVLGVRQVRVLARHEFSPVLRTFPRDFAGESGRPFVFPPEGQGGGAWLFQAPSGVLAGGVGSSLEVAVRPGPPGGAPEAVALDQLAPFGLIGPDQEPDREGVPELLAALEAGPAEESESTEATWLADLIRSDVESFREGLEHPSPGVRRLASELLSALERAPAPRQG